MGRINDSSCSVVDVRKCGRRISDEVFPELPRFLRHLGRRLQPHQPLLEAFRRQRAGERLLDDEDHPVTALAQHVRDADAVVRRAEGAFREEDHRSWRSVVGHRPRRSSGQRPVHRAQLSLSSGLAIVSICASSIGAMVPASDWQSYATSASGLNRWIDAEWATSQGRDRSRESSPRQLGRPASGYSRADGRPPDLTADHGEKEPGHEVGIDLAHFAAGRCPLDSETDLLPGRRAATHQLRRRCPETLSRRSAARRPKSDWREAKMCAATRRSCSRRLPPRRSRRRPRWPADQTPEP